MGSSFDIAGKVVLVTGAGRGLGYEMAKALAAAGAVVYINGSHPGRLRVAVDRLAQAGITVLPAAFDVADEAAAAAALDRIFADQGRFDILVNNVGVRLREPLEAIGGEQLNMMLNTNLVAAFTLSKQAAKMMAAGGYGRIINISSIASIRARTGDAAYIIVKGAMNAMTRAFCAEFGQYGITANAILPGPFHTETNDESFAAPGMDQFFRNRIPLQRPGIPAEIGGVALFLASPASGYISGVTLPVDGGYLATS